MKNFTELGVRVPSVLLPAQSDIGHWAVIACDQYTQDQKYWDKVAGSAQGQPSTYDLILPEIFLHDDKKKERIEKIHEAMHKYLEGGVFAPELRNFIYIERKTSFGRTRKGLICELDLEAYDWQPGTLALVRATEATIPERIPPRKEIRRWAPLESPHIMLLANDRNRLLVEASGQLAKASGNAPVYEGNLMLGGGGITGWKINAGADTDAFCRAVEKLAEANTDESGNVFLFAVGDGNHSLATAKAVWDDHKKTIPESEWADCRVRYALVEIVNLYDEGLTFEPIHRVVFGADALALAQKIASRLSGSVRECGSFEELACEVEKSRSAFGFAFVVGGKRRQLLLEAKLAGLAVAQFQPALDAALAEAGGQPDIDFIHGRDEVERLGGQENAVAILLPPISKDSFFDTIRERGVLPRKSFSMGEADEKRFYLECRRLF